MYWLSFLLAFQQALWIDVPFIQQDKNGCGSASIWMVMEHWKPGSAPPVEQIQGQLYSAKAGGIYAKDMARYFEEHGYRAFTFRGEWADLEQHLAKGRPLIVGAPLHYVVVAGINTEQNIVLVNDPAHRKLMSVSREEFENDWKATGNWTLLAVPEIDFAGEAFRKEDFAEAQDHLTAAVRANPNDAYTNDFLATVFFLRNNPAAALKYWNRAGKPEIENIRVDPPLQLDPVLLDRAFTFSRGSRLKLSDFETAQARLDALHVFSRYQLELLASNGERFDVRLRAAERKGANLLSWFRGVPFQTVNPEFSNIGGKAINVGSLLRWDSNKRRASVFVEAPLRSSPKWGFRLAADGRQENWAAPSQDFQMRKLDFTAEIRSVPSGRRSWTSGAGIATRRFSNSLSSGTTLKYTGSVTQVLVKEPDRQFELDSSAAVQAGKLFAANRPRFAKVEGRLSARWRALTSQIRFGRGFGQLPFDEQFLVGLDRDSDLALRGHLATVDGRKNASNAARAHITANTDFQKKVLETGWFRLTAGPFIDISKFAVSRRWTADAGIEVRCAVLGSWTVHFSFGRGLSDAQRAFFISVPQ